MRALYGDAAHDVAQTIGGAVYLMTPITERAEAWFQAWGGTTEVRIRVGVMDQIPLVATSIRSR